ncbi:MAG: TetR/AcrR family transcriptional regulator [Rhizobiaceae bacterium]|nr:TetR/AcrR family transcriptional regulator [Rhizobiaceae bacterium]
MSKATERKAKLHADLVDAAETRIASHGVASLRARDLANDVGCSLGSIYNVFDDLHTLILHANMRTLDRIDKVMTDAAGDVEKDPLNGLVGLAWAYFDFADSQTRTWRALFDHAFPEDHELPDWIYQGQVELLQHIEQPLQQILPDAQPERVQLIARTLFSSVHGIVELSLDDRTVGLPKEAVRDQLRLLVCGFLAGYEN